MNHMQQPLGDDDLHDFLNSAPKYFREGERIKKFQLKNGDYIHCVLWNYHFYITGTDIVKILVWRFQNSGRQLGNMKKFEEGIFSDLRNLKPGIDASLECPRSEFLEFLYKNGCIRTQKKQKVFYWYSVPHDALFCDALERDLRRDTSIYSYNGYQTEQRVQYPNIVPAQKFSPYQKTQAPLAACTTFEYPRRVEKQSDVRVNPFNIGGSLFGEISPSLQAASQVGGASKCDTRKECMFEKLFQGDNKGKVPQFEDYEDERKQQSEKRRSECGARDKFDDFDLDQLGFLKERYQEQYGFRDGPCEKKRIQEPTKSVDGDIGTSAKVRFVQLDGQGNNE